MIKPESSSHWYKKPSGEPFYEITGKNGKVRAPRIMEAIACGCVPSATTVMRVIAKPGLEAWKQTQLLVSALTHPNPDNLPADEFAKVIIEESSQVSTDAKSKGEDGHSQAEVYLKTGQITGPFGQAVADWCKANNVDPIHIELPFAADEFGGRIDLIADVNNVRSIIDFKTQNTKGKDFTFYSDWAIQLAAYRWGVSQKIKVAQCISVALDTFESNGHTPRLEVKVWDNYTEALAAFRAALYIWQFQNNWFQRIKDATSANEIEAVLSSPQSTNNESTII